MMSVDLAEPETPVTQVKSPKGSDVQFFKLLPVGRGCGSRCPVCAACAAAGSGMRRLPLKY